MLNTISTKWISVFVIASVLCFSVFFQSAFAASDYLLKLDGIPGYSNDKNNPGTIELASWSFGASNSGSMSPGTGAGSGKVSMSSFTITKRIDKSSPLLFRSALAGSVIKEATFIAMMPGTATPLTIKLEDLIISSYGTTSGGDRPMESISFSFSKISY